MMTRPLRFQRTAERDTPAGPETGSRGGHFTGTGLGFG